MDTTQEASSALPRPGANQPDRMAARIIRVLGLSVRPLKSAELRNALGLQAAEFRRAFLWLDENGYIAHSGAGLSGREGYDGVAAWFLASKGRSWAEEQNALAQRGEPGNERRANELALYKK